MNLEDWKEIAEYCLAKPCTYESRPFGEEPICYRLAGKIFVQLTHKPDWFKATVKTNPEKAEIYRSIYPGVVVRGYHCPPVQQPYWNTLELTELSKEVVFQMIDEAYEEVRSRLPKKEQKKLPLLASCQFVKTDGNNLDFALLCDKLDANLDEIVGNAFDRQEYVQYNGTDSIHDVIVVYYEGKPVASGSYKLYDENSAELKRVYVDKSMRRTGLGKELVRRLEADAKIHGFKTMILETGEPLVEACALYKKLGYKVIPNYGQYEEMEASICMSKKI